MDVTKLLTQVKNNEISIEQAEAELKNLPYEDLGFAKLDHHRKVRQGFEEVVYCQGKATPHLVKIYQTLTAEGIDVLGTRASREQYEAVKAVDASRLKVVYEDADVLIINKPSGMLSQKAVPEDISANEYILSYLIRKGELTEEQWKTFRPSICNRLDRNTSGLLIAGKSLNGLQQMAEALKKAGAEHFTYREYAGMGHWTWDRAYAEYDDIKALFAELAKRK